MNQAEYQEKIKSLDERIKIEIVKKSSEYLNLKKLYDDGVFTKSEFESKFEELKSNVNFTKENDNTNKTKINLNNLIGLWGCENYIFEFLHSGDFFFKINSFSVFDINYIPKQNMFNREVFTGRWLLFENEKCIIKMDKSNVKIEPLVIENQNLKIRLNSEILICEKINDEI